MRSSILGPTRIAMWLGLILLLAGSCLGKGGRDFAGYFQVREAAPQGALVKVSLVLRVFNYTQTGIQGASLILESSGPGGKPLRLASGVNIAPKGSCQFTVPRSDYERWQKGKPMELVIKFAGPNGARIRRPFEVLRMHGSQEE